VVSGIMPMFCVFSHLNQNSSTSETIYHFEVSHKSPLISYTLIHRKHQIKDISVSWKQEVVKGRCSADGVDKATSNFPDKESSLLPKPLDWLMHQISQSYNNWKWH